MRGDGDGGGGERRTKKPVINTDDPVQKMFGEISLYLDTRHDKREKLVKLSRDVTIESKRIIFCLHRFDELWSVSLVNIVTLLHCQDQD